MISPQARLKLVLGMKSLGLGRRQNLSVMGDQGSIQALLGLGRLGKVVESGFLLVFLSPVSKVSLPAMKHTSINHY